MAIRTKFLMLWICLLLTACSSQLINSSTEPVEVGEVCLAPLMFNEEMEYGKSAGYYPVPNTEKRDAYISLVNALKEKGFSIRDIDSMQNTRNCASVIDGEVVFSWDLYTFPSEINLRFYQRGKLIAEGNYAARNNLNLTKFINVQEKFKEMLDLMLPNTTSRRSASGRPYRSR